MSSGLFALQFVLKLFVEAEGLLPAFEFVAGLLDFCFVRPEIKEQIGLRHVGSLRCGVVASQGEPIGKARPRYAEERHIGPAEGAVLAYYS